MVDESTIERVRQLCQAAMLPISEEELVDLAARYEFLSAGIERLATYVLPEDLPAIAFAVEEL